MKVYVLISDVGLNGFVVHGVYSAEPSADVIRAAALFSRGWTGYQNTTVEEHDLDLGLPCGGQCTRRDPGVDPWSNCFCYRACLTVVDGARGIAK